MTQEKTIKELIDFINIHHKGRVPDYMIEKIKKYFEIKKRRL